MEGFHANDKIRCEKFLSDYSYLIISEDEDFLGNGMYFWEYESEARWWKKEQNKDVIVSAEIMTDEMLDLKDEEVCEKVQHMYECLSICVKSRYQKRYPNMDIQSGVKLNAIFEGLGFIMINYKVIRSTRIYDKKDPLFLEGTKLSARAVDIYCVRVPDVVTQRVKI